MFRLIATLIVLLATACNTGNAGLLTVCWLNNQADYSGDCEELRWERSKIPLTVMIDVDSDYEKTIREGYEFWNEEAGSLFRFVTTAPALVRVEMGSASGNASQSTSHTGNPISGATGALHSIRQPEGLFQMFCDSAHEAGHVLGLAHDSSGLMASDFDCSEIRTVVPNGDDVELLRDLYLR